MPRALTLTLLALLCVLAPAASAARATRAFDVERAALVQINGYRASLGLRPLHLSSRLRRAAAGHSRDMVRHDYFDHTDRQGHTVAERASHQGYRWRAIGENIAWGSGIQDPATWVVKAWRNSPPHDAAMRSPDYRDAGLGVVCAAPDACTFTLVLGRLQGT